MDALAAETFDKHKPLPRWRTGVAFLFYFTALLFALSFAVWARQMYLVGGSVSQAWSLAVLRGWGVVLYVVTCVLGVVGFSTLGLWMTSQRKSLLQMALAALFFGALLCGIGVLTCL